MRKKKTKELKKRGKTRQPGMIRMNLKKGNKRKHHAQDTAKMVFAVVVLLALLGVIAGLWAGSRVIMRELYSRNSTFVIKHIDIKGGLMMAPALIREYMQIDEGQNLFSLDIERLRDDFLRRAPGVESLEIKRVLPDTLSISVKERMPLARLGRHGPLVVDRYGMIFVFRGPFSQLPKIIGYEERGMRPGVKILGMAQAALEVLKAIDDNPSLALDAASVDVRRPDYLVLRLSDGKVIKLAWKEMRMQSETSREALVRKLEKVSAVLRSRKGMRISMLDATLDENMPGN